MNVARAFSDGCDARLSGKSLHTNPYSERSMYEYWRFGWFDVDKNWGIKAKWPIKMVPPVDERLGGKNGD